MLGLCVFKVSGELHNRVYLKPGRFPSILYLFFCLRLSFYSAIPIIHMLFLLSCLLLCEFSEFHLFPLVFFFFSLCFELISSIWFSKPLTFLPLLTINQNSVFSTGKCFILYSSIWIFSVKILLKFSAVLFLENRSKLLPDLYYWCWSPFQVHSPVLCCSLALFSTRLA